MHNQPVENEDKGINFPEILLSHLSNRILNIYGLTDGKMGLILCYYTLSRLSTDTKYEESAKQLLDELSENIGAVEELGFENGLAGIGWAIEFLAQNNYITANTNEILEDIDDVLYKNIAYTKSDNISLNNGALGKGLYFLKRFLSKNPGTLRYRTLCQQECLVLITDEIANFLLNEESGLLMAQLNLDQYAEKQILDIAQVLHFFVKLTKVRANTEVVNISICSIVKFIEKSGFLKNAVAKNEAGLHLLYSLLFAGIQLNDPIWQKEACDSFNILYNNEMSFQRIKNLYSKYIFTKFLKHITPIPSVLLKPEISEISNSNEFLMYISLSQMNSSDKWDESILLS